MSIALGSLNNLSTIVGTEKIPVSGSGNPSVTPNLIKSYIDPWLASGATTITTPTITGLPTFVGSAVIQTDALGVTQVTNSGLRLRNTTVAAVGAQQISGAISWEGSGWKTNATAAAQAVAFRSYLLPVQGAANPSGNLVFQSSINGGAFATNMTLTSGNSLSIGPTVGSSTIMVYGEASNSDGGATLAPTMTLKNTNASLGSGATFNFAGFTATAGNGSSSTQYFTNYGSSGSDPFKFRGAVIATRQSGDGITFYNNAVLSGMLGDAGYGGTFAECVGFGPGITLGNIRSTAIGYNANAQANPYSFGGGFGGYPVIVGHSALGKGVSVGYKARTDDMEATAIGPQAYAKGPATIAIGDGAKANDTGGAGNEIVMGDAAYANGNINYFIGGGCGINHDFVIGLGCQGSDTTYATSISTAAHQGFLGWYQHDASTFSGGVGLCNDWWLGGPITASAPHAITLNITSGLGADKSGVDFTITGSKGTGSGTPGAIDFQTSTAAGSSSTLQTASSKLKLNGTGVGFFAVTPVARQLVPTGSTTDTVITALQAFGLFRQS